MRTPPTNWTTIMAQPHETETRIDIAGVSYYGYDGNGGIWSCETRPMLFDKLSVGNCCSATINLVLVNPQTIPTMAKMELYVRLVGDYELKSRRIFYFIAGEQNPPAAFVSYSDEIELIDGVYHLAGDITRIAFDYRNSNEVNVIAGHYYEISGIRGESGCYYAPVGSTVETTSIPSQRRTNWLFPGRSIEPVRTDWVRKGIYYIDTREWDAQHEFLTITGYDAMLKTEQDYFTPPVTITGWPKTDAAVVSEICTRIGVELDTRTVLDKGYVVQVPAVSSDGSDSDTLREVLGWIGAMYGGNWCITDEGKLRLVPLVPTQTVAVGTDALDLSTTTAYDALGIVHLVVSEDAEYISPQTGGTGRSIEVSCPWGTQDMADNILTAIDGYVYQPLSVTTATEANPLWELGDGVTVNGYTSVIASMPTAFGLKYTADIEAPESEEINHEYPYQDKGTRNIERKIAQSSASLRIDIDAIESIVKGIAQPYVEGTRYEPNAIVYKDGKYYSCNVEAGQTSSATWVASEWTEQSSGALSSIIKQTMDSLTFSVSSGTNQSTITIKANGVDVASPVVQFSRIEADEVSANGIRAGTIQSPSSSNPINFKGNFNFYTVENILAGSFGATALSSSLSIIGFLSRNSVAGIGVGDTGDFYTTPIGSVLITGGLRLDPNFVVTDFDDLPDAGVLQDGTIGIVVL